MDEISLFQIHFQGCRLYFKATKEFVFIICINNAHKLSDSKIDKLFLKIIDSFYQNYFQKIKYQDIFPKKSEFYDFIELLEELVRNTYSSNHFLHIF